MNGSKIEREKANIDFDHAAHYVDIVGRFTHDVFTGVHLQSYIVKHKRYGNPFDVVQNDRIVIQGVTCLQAGFVCQMRTFSIQQFTHFHVLDNFMRQNN